MLHIDSTMDPDGEVTFSTRSRSIDWREGVTFTLELACADAPLAGPLAQQRQKGLERVVQALEREKMTWLSPGLRTCTIDLDGLKGFYPHWAELQQMIWPGVVDRLT